MNWWLWLSIGIGLFGLELFIPTGFYLLVIGLAFMIVGGIEWLGFLPSLNLQLATAGVLLIILVPTIRRPLSGMLRSVTTSTGSDITAQRVRVLTTIPSGGEGKGELTGSTWTVRNESGTPLFEQGEYSVSRVDGLSLIVTNGVKF